MARFSAAFSFIARLVVSVVLLGAGLAKLGDPQAFSEIIAKYQLLPESLTFLVALYLPWLETLVGACLLVGFLNRACATIAACLSGLFGVGVASAVVRGLDVSCGCYSGDSKVSWGHVALDLFLLACSVLIVAKGPNGLSIDKKMESKSLWVDSPGKVFPAACLVLALNIAYIAVKRGHELEQPMAPSVIHGASLVFDKSLLDLGSVVQGQTVQGTTKYTNNSNKHIIITDTTASCGCTVPTLSKKELEPGESGEITLVYTPGMNQGDIEQSVKLHLADSEEAPEVVIKVKVELLLEATPALLHLETLGQRQSFTLHSHQPGLKFKVKEIETPTPALTFKVLEANPEETQIEVTMVAELPPPEQPSTVWVVAIRTDLPEVPPAVVYVQGNWTKP